MGKGPLGTLWLTGLPAAGKTTLAYATRDRFARCGWSACVLDGDELRAGLSRDLDHSRAGRAEQARRAAHVAALVAQSGVVAIVALVSPYAEDRRQARALHADRGLPFWEVWLDTPLAVCRERDPKGLYAQASAGELRGLTGVDEQYEQPVRPELRLSGSAAAPEELAERVVRLLAPRSQAD